MTRFLVLLALAPALFAQTPRRVQSVGTASITITPNQARITVGVNTTAPTAQEAADRNAAQISAVIAAVTKLVANKGTVKTVSYSLHAEYRTVPGQTQAQLTGYTATNIVEVSSNDLNLIGQIIDTAVTAGANTVGSPIFTLQDIEPVKQQALAAAAKQARAHADAIASGLGGRTGGVISALEGASFTPLAVDRLGAAAGATPTPITPGSLEISATVTLEVELQ